VQMSVEPSGALGFPSHAWSPGLEHGKDGGQDACTAAAGGQRSVGSLQRQIRALLYKNVLILRRNWVSTALRLLSCVFFMFLMWVIISAVNRHTFSKVLSIVTLCSPENNIQFGANVSEWLNSTRDNRSWVRNMPHPPAYPVEGIQDCANPGCIILAYAPAPTKGFTPSAETIAESAYPPGLAAAQRQELQRVHAIIRSTMANNRGGALTPEKIMGFASERELVQILESSQYISCSKCTGAVTLNLRIGNRMSTSSSTPTMSRLG
jgi:hypothetical protein